MGRLKKVTDLAVSSDIVSNATYGAMGQMLTMTGANGAPSETRTYNSIGQMTLLQSGNLNIQYAYPATQNNGKIASQKDLPNGEEIVYYYDSLNRLAKAETTTDPNVTQWGQSYTYDGFGNLTTVATTKGSPPNLVTTYDPATNRQTGESADANGNICGGSCGWTYDIENRIVFAGSSSYPLLAYSYAPGNKRVWRGVWNPYTHAQTVDEITFWGANGQKLTTYNLSIYGTTQLVAAASGTNYYFGGKLIKNTGGYVTPDRLGSIGKYFPYGQERPSATTDGKEKFATYFRDSETGLDYADQRYHQSGFGRFMTTDPYDGSASAKYPGSWNRYAYSGGDPVNNSDPNGLDDDGPIGPDVIGISGTSGAEMSTSGNCNPALEPFNPAFYQAMCGDVNPSVFANDLGQVGPGSGNDPLAFSGAYDLNNGAPGFGPPDPGVPPPPPPDCQSQILNATNNQFGTNYTNANVNSTFNYSTGAPSGQGTLNLNIYGSTAGVSTGYYPVNWWTYVIGYGPTLHVVSGPGGHGGLDSQQTLPFGPNQGTFHIDSGYVYNPFGAFSHWLLNITKAGGYPQC
ncbi:MAG: RHS repeat-associated core domain-containing protein [Candidatus Dormibacteraceae bacterium]